MAELRAAPRQPVLLIILDGVGVNPSRLENALAVASTPKLDFYFASYPHTVLAASGRAVGLPDGQMGNSEVGHLTLGSGCIVRQDLVAIDDAINDGRFFQNHVLNTAARRARDAGGCVHLIGLVSDGGVHSHIRHLLALIDLCQHNSVKAMLHMITDGRDTPPRCAKSFVPDVQAALARTGGDIATVMGRYYAMDRDCRWDRTEKAWRAIVLNEGRRAHDAVEAIDSAYAAGVGDEFIEPTVLDAAQPVTPRDQLVWFNFRRDRPRQLTAALVKEDFEHFDRGESVVPLPVTTLTSYDQWYDIPYAFEADAPGTTLAEIISRAGLKQFHCAETEKYPHVTYFFNGGRGEEYPGEDRRIIPSPKVATYDLAPEMSAAEVADAVVEALQSQHYAFIVVNFANGDMVGHTAVRDAVVAAVECLDRQVGRVLDHAVEQGYSVILTADHGNCDEMVDPISRTPHTQHTVYPVPCLIIDKNAWQLNTGQGLSAVAPTVLHLMGLPQPTVMSSKSLLLKPLPIEE